MLNFNTQEQERCRSGSYGREKAVSLMPNALKSGIMATVAVLLLCCFSFQSAKAQCSPDITAPTAVCSGPFTIALNTNGNAPIDPSDIDDGSSDNCGAVTLSVAPSMVNCAVLGNVTVTLTVTDNAGNTNTCSTTITVVDNLPPAITCPGNVSVNCGASTAPAATGFASAIDNCGGVLAQAGVDCSAPYATGITYCDAATSCTGNGIIRTWKATYGGLTGTCVQTISVNDTQAPVIDWNGAAAGTGSGPANASPSCSVGPALPVAFTATDNCDASPTNTVTDVSTRSADPSMCAYTSYTVTRTYKSEDDCGNMATFVQTITVVNDVPVITPPAAINLPAGSNCQTNVNMSAATVSDCTPNVHLLTAFIVRNNINNQIVNSGSGLNASGNYPAGNYTITFSAIDPCGLMGTATTAMNIVDNVAPTAVCTSALVEVSVNSLGAATLTPDMLNGGSSDNCTPTPQLTYTISPSTLNCSNVGLPNEVVTLTVFDANGNSNSCTANVQVTNNSAPAVFCKNLTVTLDAMGSVTVNASALDNGSFDACDAVAPLGFNFVNSSNVVIGSSLTFNCSQVGAQAVRVRVTEVDNNQVPNFTNHGYCDQTITVQDVTPPTVVCNNVTYNLDDDGMITLADGGAPLAPISPSAGLPVAIPDGDQVTGASSSINVTTLGAVADINVFLNISHMWVGDLRATLTGPSGATVVLFDRPGVPATTFGCSADNLMVTFDDQALLSATDFENACIANNANTYRASASLSAFEGLNMQGNWTLRVYDYATGDVGSIDNWSLTITPSLSTQLLVGASDNCSITSWTITPNMFNCSDVGDQNPSVAGVQNNDYVIVVTDPSGNTATANCPNGITILDPVAPKVTCAPLTVSTGTPESLNNVSTPGLVTLYPTDLVTGGLYMQTGNNGSGTQGINNFQITAPNVLTFTFDWSYVSNNSSAAYDKFGYYIGATFTQLTSDAGPLSQGGSASVSVTAGATFGFRAITTDNLGGNAEVWITNFSPKFAAQFKPSNWSNSSTNSNAKPPFFYDACGITAWRISKDAGATYTPATTFNCSNIGAPIPVIIRATDASNNQTTCSTTVTIIDKEAPQAQCQPLLVSLPGSGTATVPATDINFGSSDACCAQNTLTFDISKDNGVTFGSNVSFNCSNIGTHNVILRVRDCAVPANEAFCQTTITIRDLLPPTITCPGNVTINCDQSSDPSSTGLATALDNCVGVVTPTHADTYSSIVSGSPAGNYNDPNCRIITRRWEATDGTNIGLCFQTITVQDLVAPSLDWNGATAGLGTAPSTPIAVDACSVPAAATATGTDNCDTNVPVTFTVPSNNKGSNPANCSFYNYSMTRRWAAADNCGNTVSYDQVVNVSDAVAPVYSFPAMLMFNNNPGACAGTANINLLQYITDCADDQYLTISYQVDAGAVQNGNTINAVLSVGTHDVRVRAIDPCTNTTNNALALTFQIVIKDTESPTAICKPGPIPITLNSNGIANITPATINNGSNDNCGIASMTVNPASFSCATVPNPHPVVLTVTDAAGNFNTCTTTVQITNVSAPTISCPAAITVACNVFVASNPATSGGSATAMTACGPVAATYTDVTVSGVNNCRTINRTWSASTAGGTATCLQVITVTDNSPATLVGVPANTTAQACAVPAPATVTASDNCATPGVTYGETSTQDPNPALNGHYNYTVTRTWSTTDGCQSVPTTASQTITVVDNTLPIMAIPNPLVVNTDPSACNANLNINLLQYISDCAADQYLTVTNNAPSGNGSNLITGVYAIGDYTITVTANDPSTSPAGPSTQTFVLRVRDGQAPQAACLPGVTLILDSNGNGSLTPADINNGSADNCGAVNLSISPSTFNMSNVGVVPVVLTVTDNSTPPNSSMCTTPVTVIARGTVSASNTNGGAGATVSVPISVTGFDNICAMSFSMHLVGTAGNITGVSGFNLPGMTAADFNVTGNNVTFSWVSGVPVTRPDGTTIFNVNVQLTGAVGSTSTLSIDGTPTALILSRCVGGALPITAISGTVTVVVVPSNVTLSGTITREAPGGNVQLVNVAMTGSVTGNQTTGAPGTYSFTVPAGSNETITPTKDINDCNGINVLDVLILQQHILGNTLLPTPYRRIAADVNNDGAINVLDRLELHLIVLAGSPCIGLANNTSWRFVDAAYVFPNPNNPFAPPYPQTKVYTNVPTNQTGNFIGVKIGDLDLTANPATLIGNPVSDGNSNMFFSIDDYAIAAGNEYRVDFKAKDFNDFAAFQYTLQFDESVLKFKNMEMGVLPNMNAQNFGTSNAAEGTITSIWYNTEAAIIADDEVLFTLVFDAIGNANKLSNLLDIVSDPVVSEAYTSDLQQKEMGITFNGNLSGTHDVAQGKIALYQNRPNPFSAETVIPFYLPSATHATLTITDVSGKTVKTVEGDYAAGNHSVRVNKAELPATGVFFYRIDTEYGSAVKKMVLLD
jgi:subtilisin-like proprotein convertase family protein